MKSVMISIKPKWCELIANGKKTVEVRKTKPKIDTPFKVYIYEPRAQCDRPIMLDFGELDFHGRGQVIGEFVCDSIFMIWDGYAGNLGDDCLTFEERENYLKGNNGYGWHISDIVIYDKPKELSEFYKPCTDIYQYCQGCKNGLVQYPSDVETYEDISGCYFDTVCLNRITKPPQSWCYCEELEE